MDSAHTTPTDTAEALTPRQLFKKLGPTGILAIICSTLPPLGSIFLFAYIRMISEWLRSHEQLGPVVYFFGVVLLCGLAVMPTYSVSALSGFAFGPWVGGPAAAISFSAAAMFAYVIGRSVTGQRAVDIINSQPKWKAVHDAFLGGSWLKTLGLVTLIRLPPNSPFAVTNLVLSALRVRPDVYFLGTLIGMAPRTMLVAWLGSLGNAALEAPPESRYVKIVGLVISVFVVGLIFAIASRAITRATEKVIANSAA
jgi:uncharacterized membrane protein YdjX (TVP38/TMEM64 family)